MPTFEKVYSRAAPFTIVSEERCRRLYDLACTARTVAGDVAELGVYKGGTSLMLAEFMSDRIVHAFDTFNGMPETATKVDVHKAGDFGDTSLEAVRRAFAGHSNISIHAGFFPATAVALVNKKFCLTHFDGDIYQSCKDFISFFWPRMTPGGIMVFDDWEWGNCPGVKKAIDEAGINVTESARFQCFAVRQIP